MNSQFENIGGLIVFSDAPFTSFWEEIQNIYTWLITDIGICVPRLYCLPMRQMVVELASHIIISSWTMIRQAQTKVSNLFRIFFASIYSMVENTEQIIISESLVMKKELKELFIVGCNA